LFYAFAVGLIIVLIANLVSVALEPARKDDVLERALGRREESRTEFVTGPKHRSFLEILF